MIKLTSPFYKFCTIFKIQNLKIIDKLSTMTRAIMRDELKGGEKNVSMDEIQK